MRTRFPAFENIRRSKSVYWVLISSSTHCTSLRGPVPSMILSLGIQDKYHKYFLWRATLWLGVAHRNRLPNALSGNKRFGGGTLEHEEERLERWRNRNASHLSWVFGTECRFTKETGRSSIGNSLDDRPWQGRVMGTDHLLFVWRGWRWSGGDGVGNEAEPVGKSYPRLGLTGHAKKIHILSSLCWGIIRDFGGICFVNQRLYLLRHFSKPWWLWRR